MASVAHSHPVGKAPKGGNYPVPWEKNWAGEFPNSLLFKRGGTQEARRQWELGGQQARGRDGGFLPGSLGSMKQEKALTRVKSG